VTKAGIAIRAIGLCKVYHCYKHPVDALLELVMRRQRHDRFVALDTVNLEVRQGEIVGILGRNGAGKSTLLKLIAGTLERSSGDLDVHGRITAILELGTGFHMDYTGRENIYMGGLCLGMSRREIDEKLEDIIQFSELSDFIDRPFKTYSTGMQARLTFSTATSIDPDIMIVDEALSVGDARFQLKCFNRLQQMRERQTTILLVSHDTNTITSLCDRAMILESGRVYAEGNPKHISVSYQNLLFGSSKTKKDMLIERARDLKNNGIDKDPDSNAENAQPNKKNSKQPRNDKVISSETKLRYGSGEARLLDWGLLNDQGNDCNVIASGTACRLYMILRTMADFDDLSVGFAIKDRRGSVLWGVTNITQKYPPYQARSGETLTIVADCMMWLANGDYFVTLGAAHLNGGDKIDFVEDAIEFKIIGTSGIFTTSIVNLQTNFRIMDGNAIKIKK